MKNNGAHQTQLYSTSTFYNILLNQVDGLGEQLLSSSGPTSHLFAHQLPDGYQNCFHRQFGQKGRDTKSHQNNCFFNFRLEK